jgi:hypothetical protein
LSETHVGYETTVDVENFFYYPKRKWDIQSITKKIYNDT